MQRTEETLKENPSLCTVSFHTLESSVAEGFIYSKYYKKAFHFHSDCEMLDAIDDLLNSVDFPQALFEQRSFFDKKVKKIMEKAVDVVDDNTKDLSPGGKTTFIVNVQYRQNATWQGTITWVEENRTLRFRSAFEMLKLMEEANNQGTVKVIDWT